MKNLSSYANVFEYRRKKADIEAEANAKKGDGIVEPDDVDLKELPAASQGGKKVDVASATAVKPGVPADENGTGKLWAIDPPTPEDEAEWEQMDPANQSKNANRLADTFQSEQNFIALGYAGWAKTQLITKMAHRAGYHVITVYLDKAVKEDLGGIPIPYVDDKSGEAYVRTCIPTWAIKMVQMTQKNPNIKFLLFFDELNQADPGVLNALMPIVLKHEICGIHFDNMIVGAAGNRADENDSVTDIESHKPLMSRFPNKINWETHTDKTWKDHFDWARKNWESKVGKELIDEVERLKDYWSSPRDLTENLYHWVAKNRGKRNFIEPEVMIEKIEPSIVWDQVDKTTRTYKDMIAKFAQWLVDYVNRKEKDPSKENAGKRRGKGKDQVDEKAKSDIINCLTKGFFYFASGTYEGGDNKRYVCTKENVITELFDPSVTGINAEMLNKIIRDMEANGKKVKYDTNADAKDDAKKNGWIFPSDAEGFIASSALKAIKEPEAKPAKRHTDD